MFRLAVATLVIGLAGGAAQAASSATCSQMIGDVQTYLDAHPGASGTRKQSKDAQLMHQPTRQSVTKAKMESHDNLVVLLGQARSKHSAGDEAGCRATLADVERMLKP
jgi:hypothetical protein